MSVLFVPYLIAFITTLTCSRGSETFKVTGTIVSSYTNKPIPYGVITVSITKGFRVDGSGKFVIDGLNEGKHTLSFSAFGYKSEDTIINIKGRNFSDLIWKVHVDCHMYNRESALKDVKSKQIKLLLQGGIAPVTYASDKTFSEKYKIRFYDLGCVAYDPSECLIAYNHTVFEYLDKTYGKSWRKEIRKDVIGLGLQ